MQQKGIYYIMMHKWNRQVYHNRRKCTQTNIGPYRADISHSWLAQGCMKAH